VGDYDTWVTKQWLKLDKAQGWLYKEYMVWVFSPIGWFNEWLSTRIWLFFMSLAYLSLVYRLLQVQNGWLIVLVTLKPFLGILLTGNIAPFLALLCTTPIGAILATFVKPYCAFFGLLYCMAFLVHVHREEYPSAYNEGHGLANLLGTLVADIKAARA
jgi:hypothetical protein